MGLAAFMATAAGRILRIVVGVVLMAVGLSLGDGWMVLAAVGVIPIVVGAANVCLIGPVIGAPFKGSAARR